MSTRISVVIPTHARETRLAFALDALAGQTLRHEEFEVIVVRAPGAAEPLAGAPDGLRARFLVASDRGPVPQRNLGWRESSAPLVAFMDDDCRPAPDWLERVLGAADREGADAGDVIVQGRTAPDPDELHLLHGLARSIDIDGPTHLYETCNLVYPRQLLERLGGFDPAFSLPHWGEDTDLGLRAERAGARLVYADTALVWHAVHPNPPHQAIREARRRRRFARLVARNPELRARMPAGVFMNETHATVAAAGAGLVAALLARRPKLALVGAAPYLFVVARNFVREGRPTPRRIARLAVHLPVRFAVDAAEVAATARGAIEERTPVV
jgi:GT2 family glycosyltransferase